MSLAENDDDGGETVSLKLWCGGACWVALGLYHLGLDFVRRLALPGLQGRLAWADCVSGMLDPRPSLVECVFYPCLLGILNLVSLNRLNFWFRASTAWQRYLRRRR